MLTWHSHLYLDEEMKVRGTGKLRQCLDEGRPAENAYLITLAANPKDQLDIVHTLFLRQKTLCSLLPPVVGVAATRKGAEALVISILEDTLRDTQSTDMRSYLIGKEAG